MHCFVATAFDRPDVDRIYDKAVRNVLKELSITPLRVDRHEHNDDIDDKIMELMRRADFCIADLTYARPSAYFEAGYMASTKPVIYIVRQDHFRQRDDDIEGNRAVHFDLKMKNIIGWKEPDAAFRKRLKARINKVLKPLIASKTKRELQSALQDNFRRLSLQSQTQELERAAENILRRNGFRTDKVRPTKSGQRKLWIKEKGNRRLQLVLFSDARFTKSDLRVFWHYDIHMTSSEESKQFRRQDTALIFASVKPINRAAFRAYFTAHSETADGSLRHDDEHDDSFGSVKTTRTKHFIDKICDPADFADRLKKVIGTLSF